MRKRRLTAALACLAFCALLLIPGSALAAADPLTISTNPTTTVGPTCDFIVNAAGENVNVTDLEGCLTTGNVTITDPDGDGDEIEVEDPIDASSCPGHELTLNEQGTGGSVEIDAAMDLGGCALTVDADQSGGSTVTEQGGSIRAAELEVDADADVSLMSADNEFGAAPGYASVVSDYGTINLTDDVATLVLDAVDSDYGFTVTNTGSISLDSTSDLEALGEDGSLTSQTGSITSVSGEFSRVGQLTLTATSVSLIGTNEVAALDASATSGDVDVDLHNGGVTLGDISASDGSVSITDDYALGLAGTITANSVTLNAGGFTASTGAALASPSIDLVDSDLSDDWAVNASTITPGTGPGIAYSGASGLSIDGGALFNVIPSAATTMTFTGNNSTPAGTLDYNAEGGLVTGTDTPPSGTIENSEYEPVSFSGMSAVNVTGAGTPPSTANAPTCTLRAASRRVTLPKRVHGKRKGKATVSLVATCNAAVNATLVGRVTVVTKARHHKKKSKGYGVARVHVALSANTAKKIVLKVPTAVVTALAKKGDKLSARFTLADPGHSDDVLKTVTIAHLT
jgi:hypothetical protein